MTTIRWKGYEWITEERWGQVHPEKPNWWYDESCVLVDNEEHFKSIHFALSIIFVSDMMNFFLISQ